MRAIVNKGLMFGMLNGVATLNSEINKVVANYLKNGRATLLLDSEDTLMYDLEDSAEDKTVGDLVQIAPTKVVWKITFSKTTKLEYEAFIEAENIADAERMLEKDPFSFVTQGAVGRLVKDDNIWLERVEVVDYKDYKSPYGRSS